MELCFSFSLFFTVQYLQVLGKIEYQTEPLPKPARVTKHVPKVISKTCYLLPQRGPCRANIKMYYYDNEEKNCTKFRWGGCQGNGNRFDSHNECMTTCLSSPNTTATRPQFCQLSFDYGFCFGAVKRWYYDRFWKVCKETIYSGCGGNQNNFYTMDKCNQVCRHKGYSKGTTEDFNRINKILIVNPPEATSKRGLNQSGRKSKALIKSTNETTKTSKGQKKKRTEIAKSDKDDNDVDDDEDGEEKRSSIGIAKNYQGGTTDILPQ